MSGTVIAIDRVPLTIVAATSTERAERVSRRVRQAVAGALPAALASAFGRQLDGDDAYVFIDRLDVHCAVALHWADDAMAAVFAERLARALLLERTLGHALVFRDRAEFLSAFLSALIDGVAGSRWWYAELDGLAVLPLSARIRTLAIAEGPVAWEALARLTPESLAGVVTALTVSDAERMLEAVAGESAVGAAPARAVTAALGAVLATALPGRAHRLITSLVHVVRSGAGPASARTLGALRAVLAMVDAARDGRLPRIPLDVPALTVSAWCEAAGVDDQDQATVLNLEAPELVECVVSHMPPMGADAAPIEGPAPFSYTPFGGALLLCVVLARNGWWVAWGDALRAAGYEKLADALAAWLALAVVARALNPTRPAAVERDAVLRRAFGAPDEPRPVPSDPTIKRALCQALASTARQRGEMVRSGRLGPELRSAGRGLLREMARRIPGCDGSTAAYLRTRCLSMAASVRGDGSAARLGRAPLDVLLKLSGLTRTEVSLPDGRRLVLREETTP